MPPKKVVFRADSSLKIGSGHIMRCLTFAGYLKKLGLECHFICRQLPGNLIEKIKSAGFQVHELKYSDKKFANGLNNLDDTFKVNEDNSDILECSYILNVLKPYLLIIDHYGIDIDWEASVYKFSNYVLVIDDLANRHHFCDFLLDQNIGRSARDYSSLLPAKSKMLIGPMYGLIKPDIVNLRARSLANRSGNLKNVILISIGGMDISNKTGEILNALMDVRSESDYQINIITGFFFPWMDGLKEISKKIPFKVNIFSNINNMEDYLLNCDLAIGAGGISALERCCLGVPSIVIPIAENQNMIAHGLAKIGAAIHLENIADLPSSIRFINNTEELKKMSLAASQVTDGLGIERIFREVFLN